MNPSALKLRITSRTRSWLVNATFAIAAASMPCAGSSTICARRQVTTDPRPRRYHRNVKFSVTLGAAGDGRDPAALAGLAALAEAAGWDAFLPEDYLSYRGLATCDPWVCLAAIAAATTRIRLGTTVTPLPRRLPWELAAQAVAVDRLSGGRLILGVGSGAADDPALTAVGTPTTAPDRAAQLDEGLEVLTALWTGTAVHHHGRWNRIDGLQLPATPVQQPRIPIWVGGDLGRPRVRRRADPMGRRSASTGSEP